MIGVLGGTFDPIHFGHLRTALDVQQALGLTEIRFIPLADPPHRPPPDTTPAQRLDMVRAATADEPTFRVDDRELRRKGKSYTLDTLRSLSEEMTTVPLCLLMGSDAFRGFPGWYQPNRILELAHLVVMQRPGEIQPPLYSDRIVKSPEQLDSRAAGQILHQSVTQLEIGATRIRQMVRKGLPPRYLVPERVLSIIQDQQLYL
ncbi:MAG: nicotinate-nucleotide adenylyltransferase [Gammaproteobacteria bacterium]|nr:nicotinate-nucleotide adenylyltransferase [Gammaproteobacteria bacterium]